MQVCFDVSPTDERLINKIVDRAALSLPLNSHFTPREVKMNLCATHNTCPLDLPALLAADDFTFVHDIYGIERHIDKTSGELTRCFIPRCIIR